MITAEAVPLPVEKLEQLKRWLGSPESAIFTTVLSGKIAALQTGMIADLMKLDDFPNYGEKVKAALEQARMLQGCIDTIKTYRELDQVSTYKLRHA